MAPRPTVSASAEPSPAGPDGVWDIVVVGDSIPFNGHFCPGCTGFVDLYADQLTKASGKSTEVINRSRDDSATMQDIEKQVTRAGDLTAQIAGADIVIVSVGYNNAMPDSSTGVRCQGDMGRTVASYVAWALATTAACLEAGIETYAEQYDRIFGAIKDLRAGLPTLFIAINVHNGNLAGRDFLNAGLPKETRAKIDQFTIGVYDRWNTMLCEKAREHGFACVDVYHAFNGPKGDRPSGDRTIDGAHPSQAGNDAIAALLAKLDTASLRP